MSYEKKTPSIRAKLSVNNYNKLIQLLTDIEHIDIEEVKEKGLEIKEKLLKYSIPDGDDVDLGFYPSQIKAVLYILLTNSKHIDICNNYYETLISNRNKFNQNKEDE